MLVLTGLFAARIAVTGALEHTGGSTRPAADVTGMALGRKDITGRIAFISDREGQAAVFIMNADGSDVRRLTHNAGEDAWPSFSPDGRRLAYQSRVNGRFQIFVMDADGNNARRLTSDSSDEFPSWSPDGSQIAFSSNRSGETAIYIMNSDGSNARRLTEGPSNNWFPAWSPDGKALAFISDRDGTHGNILLMAPDGSLLRQLTTNPLFAAKPAWSPDSERLAVFAEGGFFVMSREGRDVNPVAGEGEDPCWSPDGRWIAFASRRANQRLQIYLTPPDGSTVARVTNSPAKDWAPTWSK